MPDPRPLDPQAAIETIRAALRTAYMTGTGEANEALDALAAALASEQQRSERLERAERDASDALVEITEKLTAEQQAKAALALEILAARYRLGEMIWTFEDRHASALAALARQGLVFTMYGITEGTVRAGLTDEGKASVLGDSYESPLAAAEQARADAEALRVVAENQRRQEEVRANRAEVRAADAERERDELRDGFAEASKRLGYLLLLLEGAGWAGTVPATEALETLIDAADRAADAERRAEELLDIARAGISWTEGDVKIRLCQRIEDVLAAGETTEPAAAEAQSGDQQPGSEPGHAPSA